MPERLFDRAVLERVRRAKGISGAKLADQLGVSKVQISKWEKGTTFPSWDRLPAIAKALGEPLDSLFPRNGLPNLADLRCDAGLTQAQAGEAIGSSPTPVQKAERGRQHLSAQYVLPLARAYHVTEAELLAAQARSFGLEEPAPGRPETRSVRLDALIENAFPAGAPQDAELAKLINKAAGRRLVRGDELASLRAGGIAVEDFLPSVVDQTAFHEALAKVLDVDPLALMSEAAITRHVVDGIIRLAQSGGQLALAARGAEEYGLSPEMAMKLVEVIAQAERERLKEGE